MSSSTKPHTGFIAQRISSVVPNSVLTNGSNGTSSIYTISSSNLNQSAITIDGSPNGKMSVCVPFEINGIDVEQALRDLMAVTGVVARNRRLEEKYKGLKKEGEAYQEILRSIQNDVNIKIKEAADRYRLAEEKYKTLEIIKDSK